MAVSPAKPGWSRERKSQCFFDVRRLARLLQPGTVVTNQGPEPMRKNGHFVSDETGATATEYALLLAAMAGLLLVSLVFLGNESGTFWGSTANAIETIAR